MIKNNISVFFSFVMALSLSSHVFTSQVMPSQSSIAKGYQPEEKKSKYQLDGDELDEQTKALFHEVVESASSFVDRYAADVWLKDMDNRLKRFIRNDPDKRLKILKAVHREASRFEIEPELVLSVIQVESAFNEYAISVVGAQGLMQIMPFWRNELGRPDANLMDIDTNIYFGCAILKTYLNREKGNIAPALARYNGSYGRMKYPNKVFRAQNRRWFK